MTFRKRAHRGAVLLDMTPMVDTAFNLLVFFVLTSSFVIQSAIKVSLPEVKNATVAPTAGKPGLEVRIDAANQVFLGDRPVGLEELRFELERVGATQPVFILGDREASLGRTLEVWDTAKSAGVRELNIKTRWKK
ncbi:MAG: biopolymer transporter ExbD [Planctomycetes bacterium]|nr:biopolymer transporter ExbD [Planctomycetota bacterium]